MYSEQLNHFLKQNKFKNHFDAREDEKHPIHVAIEAENIDLVQELVALKVDLNAMDGQQQTAISLAFKSKKSKKIQEYIYQKISSNFTKSHAKFFDIRRNQNSQVHEVGKQFQSVMTSHQSNQTVIATGLSKRGLIAARSYPYQVALMKIEDIEKLAYLKGNTQKIVEISDWFNGGYVAEGKLNMNWARFSIESYQGSNVSLQIQPSMHQLANFHQSNVGRYDKNGKNSILAMLRQFTFDDDTNVNHNPEKEKRLASLILKCCKDGTIINKEMLVDNDLGDYLKEKEETQLKKLNSFIHLLTIEEVHRRLYPGSLEEKSYNRIQEALPMGIAISMGLHLMAAGELSFDKFFLKDLPSIGPFTHDQIISEEGLLTYHKKMKKLIALFSKNFPNYPLTTEGMHQLMLETFGGADESDGETYDSDEEPVYDTSDFQRKHQELSLVRAIKHRKSYKFVAQLIDNDVPLNAKNSKGQTALHLAVLKNRVDLVQLLLNAGVNDDLKDEDNKTALALAIEKSHSMMRLILEKNQNYFENYRNNSLQTLLHEAILGNANFDYIAKLIDDYRIDLNALDKLGNTALHYAVQKNREDVVLYLIENKALLRIQNTMGHAPAHYAQGDILDLVDCNEIVESYCIRDLETNKYGQTKLHQAVLNNDFTHFVYYINQHIDINAQDIFGCTALHYAVKEHLLNFAIYLIHQQANTEIRDFANHTALFYAVQKKFKDLGRFLWSYSATIDIETKELALDIEDEARFYQDLANPI